MMTTCALMAKKIADDTCRKIELQREIEKNRAIQKGLKLFYPWIEDIIEKAALEGAYGIDLVITRDDAEIYACITCNWRIGETLKLPISFYEILEEAKSELERGCFKIGKIYRYSDSWRHTSGKEATVNISWR